MVDREVCTTEKRHLVVLELTGRSTLRKNDILSFYKAQEMVDQEVCTPEKRRPRRFRVDQEVCTSEKRRPRRFRVDQEVNPPEKRHLVVLQRIRGG